MRRIWLHQVFLAALIFSPKAAPQEPLLEKGVMPTLSIVLATNRPGVYDIVLHSLAGQTSKDYELIVVDDILDARRDAILAMTQKLGVNLSRLVRSKRKTTAPKSRGGEANAYNTGIMMSRGRIITFLNDFTWLPGDFVASTITAFEAIGPLGLLAYPYDAYAPCEMEAESSAHESDLRSEGLGLACRGGGEVDTDKLTDSSSLSIFRGPDGLNTPPAARGWFSFEASFAGDRGGGLRRLKESYWDGPAFSATLKLIELLNGWDEIYDTGNGFANTDIARRAALVHGPLADAWVHLDLAVQHIESRRFGVEGLTQNAPLAGSKGKGGGGEKWVWSRAYTNYPLHLLKMDKMAMGEYPVVSPNRFEIATVRANGPHVGEGDLDKAISGMLDGGLVDERWRMFHGSEGRYVLSPRVQSDGGGVAMMNASAFEALAAGGWYQGWAGMEQRGKLVYVNASRRVVTEEQGANARVLVVLDHEGVGGASEDAAFDVLASLAAAKVMLKNKFIAKGIRLVNGLIGDASGGGMCGDLRGCLHGAERRWTPTALPPSATHGEGYVPIMQTPASYTFGPLPGAVLGAMAEGTWGIRGDAVVCGRPAGVCEAAWASGRPSLLVLAGPLEKGREERTAWFDFIGRFRAAAESGNAIMVACSRYTQEYVRYFTGVVPLLAPPPPPIVGKDAKNGLLRFDSSRPIIVVDMPTTWGAHDAILGVITESLKASGIDTIRLPPAKLSGGARACVLLPWDADPSLASGILAAGVPLFAPNLPLLANLDAAVSILASRHYWQGAPPLDAFGGGGPHPADTSSGALFKWTGLAAAWLDWGAGVATFHDPMGVGKLVLDADLEVMSKGAIEEGERMRVEAEQVWSRILSDLLALETSRRGKPSAEVFASAAAPLDERDQPSVGGARAVLAEVARSNSVLMAAMGKAEWSGAGVGLRSGASAEVQIFLSFDRVGMGVLRLSSLFPIRQTIAEWCGRVSRARVAVLSPGQCLSILQTIEGALDKHPWWRWASVLVPGRLRDLAQSLTDGLSVYQVEAIASTRNHAGGHRPHL